MTDYKTSLAANAIAENLFAQIDDEGNRHVLFQEIIDHRTNGKQTLQEDAFVTTRTGTRRRRETTVGWDLLVQWKDQSTTWVTLKDMKEAYPVQSAEYAVQARIVEEPAFAWWAPHTLKKRNRIIAKVTQNRPRGQRNRRFEWEYILVGRYLKGNEKRPPGIRGMGKE